MYPRPGPRDYTHFKAVYPQLSQRGREIRKRYAFFTRARKFKDQRTKGVSMRESRLAEIIIPQRYSYSHESRVYSECTVPTRPHGAYTLDTTHVFFVISTQVTTPEIRLPATSWEADCRDRLDDSVYPGVPYAIIRYKGRSTGSSLCPAQ